MNEHPDIHLPSPSFWPITLALGLTLIAIGVVSSFIVSIVGVIVLLIAIAGWTMENRADGMEEHHE
ncbi:MAG: cytochrome c oxidase subunit 4 [Anaerolineales bacterium]|nr:cytochrome c oxidase subunit 4 [Anaerolineales bacterium]MCB9112935.1 cytochrome c oxidase subunit 4 [Anaerolineales bacterium]